MKSELLKNGVDIWGGIECTYNRVNNSYMDQLERAGHYNRNDDLDRIASL
jgi:dTDP-4-dehydrorhamnose reductase